MASAKRAFLLELLFGELERADSVLREATAPENSRAHLRRFASSGQRFGAAVEARDREGPPGVLPEPRVPEGEPRIQGVTGSRRI